MINHAGVVHVPFIYFTNLINFTNFTNLTNFTNFTSTSHRNKAKFNSGTMHGPFVRSLAIHTKRNEMINDLNILYWNRIQF